MRSQHLLAKRQDSQPVLDRAAVVENWEVILTVAVEVCESDLVAVFTDSLAFAYRGKHAGVEVRFDGAAAVDDEAAGSFDSVDVGKFKAQNVKILTKTWMRE